MNRSAAGVPQSEGSRAAAASARVAQRTSSRACARWERTSSRARRTTSGCSARSRTGNRSQGSTGTEGPLLVARSGPSAIFRRRSGDPFGLSAARRATVSGRGVAVRQGHRIERGHHGVFDDHGYRLVEIVDEHEPRVPVTFVAQMHAMGGVAVDIAVVEFVGVLAPAANAPDALVAPLGMAQAAPKRALSTLQLCALAHATDRRGRAAHGAVSCPMNDLSWFADRVEIAP